MDDYTQSTLLGQTGYLIVEDGVIVESKRLSQSSKQLVPFESLEHNPEVVFSSSRWAFWATVVFGLLAVVMVVDYFSSSNATASAIVFYAVGAAASSLIYFASRKTRLVFFSKHHRLVFKRPADNPDLDAFIDRMKRAKLEFFHNKLENQASVFDVNEQQRYLVGLRESGILDDAALAELNELLKVEPKPRIGFV